MTTPKTGPQDLPPKGGYAPFQIDRVKLRSLFKGRYTVALFVAANVISVPLYVKAWKEVKKSKIELKSAELAALPILFAENDRVELKYMKRMQELEADVMKDFPHWEAGTLFGVPVYESLPSDTYVAPTVMECYAFAHRHQIPSIAYSVLLS